MPVAASHADIMSEWEQILGIYKEHASKLAAFEPLRAALEESLERVRELKAEQLRYTALKQMATQNLLEQTAIGRERARRVRSAVKATLGTDSELLVSFSIAPIRKRGSRRKKTETGEGTPTQKAGEASET
jgi:predicted PP-loop superfamily ATPase